MCHCGTLSMTWQRSPHHRFAGAEEGDRREDLAPRGSGGKIRGHGYIKLDKGGFQF